MPGHTFIRGELVDLKTIEEEDIEFLRRGRNHPSIGEFLTLYPFDAKQSRQAYEQFICNDSGINLLIVPREGEFAGNPVGHVWINPIDELNDRGMLGVWCVPEAQRKKFAQDALMHLMDYGFENVGLHRIVLETAETNKVIQRMVESAGFVLEGKKREVEYRDGTYSDMYQYSILESEWIGLDDMKATWDLDSAE